MHTPKHRPRKRFGQNFLHDEGVIQEIARAIAARKCEHIVEIGPGEGALTAALRAADCKLDAIELDRDLHASLVSSFSENKKFSLHNADALEFDFASLISQKNSAQNDRMKLRIVGNL